MICHVCHQPATGQCQRCSKFYCPVHGNVTCQPCHMAAYNPTAVAAPLIVTQAPAGSAPHCFACRQPVVRACGHCGRFCCRKHFSSWGRICTRCQAFQVVGMVVIGFLLLLTFAFVGAVNVLRSDEPERPVSVPDWPPKPPEFPYGYVPQHESKTSSKPARESKSSGSQSRGSQAPVKKTAADGAASPNGA
jgi:hypothetical protein